MSMETISPNQERRAWLRDLIDFYNDDVDRTNFFRVPDFGRDIYITAATDICSSCHTPVTAGEIMRGEVHWDRINGDSRYGHEPMHETCYVKMCARSTAQDKMWDAMEILYNAGISMETLSIFGKTRSAFRDWVEHHERDEEQRLQAADDKMEAAREAARQLAREAMAARDQRVADLKAEFDNGFCECEACKAEFDRGFNDTE